MSKFTDIEQEYLRTQRLGRLDTIDIGGLNMGETQKFRKVARNV